MRSIRVSLYSVAAAVTFVGVIAQNAVAVLRDYTIDPTQSSITISGTVFSADLNQTRNIVEQSAGSLTTSYTGTIKSDRALSTFTLTGGSNIDASVKGSYQPLADATAGNAPADYGGRANFTVIFTVPVNFAGRDLIADAISGPLAINGSNQFDISAAIIEFTSGNLAYRDSLGQAVGAESIVGEDASLTGNATLGTVAQSNRVYETLTIPISSNFVLADASATINLTLTGTLVGKYLIPASSGDYNSNGTVDAADYVLWRDMQGQTGVGLAADGNGDNQVNQADYTYWRAKFGQTIAGSGAGELGAGTVPEPAGAALLICLAAIAIGRRAKR